MAQSDMEIYFAYFSRVFKFCVASRVTHSIVLCEIGTSAIGKASFREYTSPHEVIEVSSTTSLPKHYHTLWLDTLEQGFTSASAPVKYFTSLLRVQCS